MADVLLSKTEFAHLLNAGKSTISGLCGKGLPTQDGKIPRAEALRWILHYCSGFRGGWGTGGRSGKASIRDRVEVLLAGKPIKTTPDPGLDVDVHAALAAAEAGAVILTTRRELLDQIRADAVRELPELALRFGLPIGAALALPTIFDALVYQFCDALAEVCYTECYGDLECLPDPSEADLKALAERFNLKPEFAAWKKEADALIDRFDLAWWHKNEGHPPVPRKRPRTRKAQGAEP